MVRFKLYCSQLAHYTRYMELTYARLCLMQLTLSVTA